MTSRILFYDNLMVFVFHLFLLLIQFSYNLNSPIRLILISFIPYSSLYGYLNFEDILLYILKCLRYTSNNNC